MAEIDRVRSVLDDELRSAAQVAARCGLLTSAAEACLRELRRQGEAEFMEVKNTFRWRLAHTTTRHQGVPAQVMDRTSA